MKLSEAQDHQALIEKLTEQLNVAINKAVSDGSFVDVEVVVYETLSHQRQTPKILTVVTAIPSRIKLD